MKEDGLEVAKERSRKYPIQTITDDTDDIALLVITSAEAESQLHSLEQAGGGIDWIYEL